MEIGLFLVTKNLIDNIKKIKIDDKVYGSDHCPVILKLKFYYILIFKKKLIFFYLSKNIYNKV